METNLQCSDPLKTLWVHRPIEIFGSPKLLVEMTPTVCHFLLFYQLFCYFRHRESNCDIVSSGPKKWCLKQRTHSSLSLIFTSRLLQPPIECLHRGPSTTSPSSTVFRGPWIASLPWHVRYPRHR